MCHGKLIFKATRIFVSDVLSQVVWGMDWDVIIDVLRESITERPFSKASLFAGDALEKEGGRYTKTA